MNDILFCSDVIQKILNAQFYNKNMDDVIALNHCEMSNEMMVKKKHLSTTKLLTFSVHKCKIFKRLGLDIRSAFLAF